VGLTFAPGGTDFVAQVYAGAGSVDESVTLPLGDVAEHSMEVRFDGTNLGLYVDGALQLTAAGVPPTQFDSLEFYAGADPFSRRVITEVAVQLL
jgi:hypothetical protein